MEQQIRTSLESFTRRLRSAHDVELDTLARDLMQAVEAADERVHAHAAAQVQARESELRTEFEQQLSREIDAARAQARAEAEADAAQHRADAATARANEREARLEAVERLLASVRRIDAAPGLRDTLEVLLQSASLEAPRVAVLLIEGNSVRAFSHRGFGEVPETGALAAGGIIEACVESGQPVSTTDPSALKAPAFAELPEDRAGFAAPLRVGNRVVAVLYADDAADGAHDAPAAWPEALELLARHASLHLENLTALRFAGSSSSSSSQFDAELSTGPGTGTGADPESARRYARLLISEIKLYNESEVRLGREHRDLRARLGGQIERARRAYVERIPETLPDRDRYFESELVDTLAGGDASAL